MISDAVIANELFTIGNLKDIEKPMKDFIILQAGNRIKSKRSRPSIESSTTDGSSST